MHIQQNSTFILKRIMYEKTFSTEMKIISLVLLKPNIFRGLKTILHLSYGWIHLTTFFNVLHN